MFNVRSDVETSDLAIFAKLGGERGPSDPYDQRSDPDAQLAKYPPLAKRPVAQRGSRDEATPVCERTRAERRNCLSNSCK